MPGDPLFRVFYLLGYVAFAVVLAAGAYLIADDLRERREAEHARLSVGEAFAGSA